MIKSKRITTFQVLFHIFLSITYSYSQHDMPKIPKGKLLPTPISIRSVLTPSVNAFYGEDVVFKENFESETTSWTTTGSYSIGTPQKALKSGYNSLNSAATNLTKNYPDNADGWLISQIISLPNLIKKSEELKLTFWERFQIESQYDHGMVKISTDDGRKWTLLSDRSGSSEWRKTTIDITAYSGQSIKLGFHFTSDDSISYEGWSIDEIQIDLYESDPLKATMISLNPQKFPFIYMNVGADTFGVGFPTLKQSNFKVYENNILQTDYFEVTPPDYGGGSRLADIIFLMDNSGSMSEEIAAVSNNVIDFVNNLASAGVNFALGLCRYGASALAGNPIIEDNGILATDANYFKTNVWQRNVVDGGSEPGYYATTESSNSFSFRPGAQKIFIIITDETPNQGGASLDDALSVCTNNHITLFALTTSDLYGTFSPITSVTNGAYFDIYTNFDDILTYISTQVANNYLVKYKSSNPLFDGTLRLVDVVVTYRANKDTCSGSYIPGAAPIIQRTQATIDLHNKAWNEATSFTIEAYITDNVFPYVSSARLFYRKSGTSIYNFADMSLISGNIYQGIIPGSAALTPGFDYYITATDGQNTASDPSVDPNSVPYQIAILPNVAPTITHTPVTTLTPGNPIRIVADITDNTNSLSGAKLYYRQTGQLIYQNVDMTNTYANHYEAEIPDSMVTNDGVEYFLRAWDDFGVSSYSGTADNPSQIEAPGATLVIKDASNSHNLIKNTEFEIYKVDKSNPVIESFKGTRTTDSYGKLILAANWFNIKDWIKVKKTVDTLEALKENHEAVDGVMCYIDIDNAIFNNNDGGISYDSLSTFPEQEIILGHTTIKFNLVVSVEWDASQEYLDNLREVFRYMSNYWYDVSDGQLCIHKIAIYDNSQLWDSSDVRIYASNQEWPHFDAPDINYFGIITKDDKISMPRIFYYNSYDAQRNLTEAESLYPFDWTKKDIVGYPNVIYPSVRTLAHEFGHYGLMFYDEHINNSRQSVFPGITAPGTFHFGIMDAQIINDPQNSEMSSALQYADNSHRITWQWKGHNNRSCWDYFESKFEGTYNDIFCPIIKPSERVPNNQMFAGPNDDLESPTFDIGSMMKSAPDQNFNGNSFVFTVINRDSSGYPIGNSRVTLFKDNKTRIIEQGKTADNGKIKCLGVNNGDIIRCYARTGFDWFYGDFTVGTFGLKKSNSITSSYSSSDSVSMMLDTMQKGYFMINDLQFKNLNTIEYDLTTNKNLLQAPTLELYKASGEIKHYNFNAMGTQYLAEDIAINTGRHTFEITGLDSSSNKYFILTKGIVSDFSSILYSTEGECEVWVDSLNNSIIKFAVLTSEFIPILTGLEANAEQGGATHSISIYPEIAELDGHNYITIRYADSELKNNLESNLRIFKWSNDEKKWKFVGGEVDTLRNEVTSAITSFGIYGAFTTTSAGSPGTGSKLDNENIYFYPNPFNPDEKTGTIRYSLSKTGNVTIKIYDVAGGLVRTLIKDIPKEAIVENSEEWDGKNDKGDIAANGVYFYVIKSSSNERAVGKVAIVR